MEIMANLFLVLACDEALGHRYPSSNHDTLTARKEFEEEHGILLLSNRFQSQKQFSFKFFLKSVTDFLRTDFPHSAQSIVNEYTN